MKPMSWFALGILAAQLSTDDELQGLASMLIGAIGKAGKKAPPVPTVTVP